ncbi:MAG TPA: DUF72 domain-containing protein [Terriglobia bacterium]|nr:DUF72 domain-containing protein [Terriglobia bacterium]
MEERIWIGTSGWHYKHWRGPFYPESMPDRELLDFYAERLRTVEINNSFYHLPSRKSVNNWRESTPKGFLFAVKSSRYITHLKRLKDPKQGIQKFFSRALTLDSKLGPVLFQLPPNWKSDVPRLRNFLEALPKGQRYAFEFRDPSWFNAETYKVLERYGGALCVSDLAGEESPKVLTGKFAYLRLHGPAKQKYSGRYTRAQLRRWLDYCRRWLKKGAKEVFIYFDNDQAGFAALNALELQTMVRRR